MRLPGDVACFVELIHVTVLSVVDGAMPERLAYIRGGDGTVACTSSPTPGSAWMVSISGGVRPHPLEVGVPVIVQGVHRVTGDPFSVPTRLLCTGAGDVARFAVPFARPVRAIRASVPMRW
ncbi:MAG: hypothetical protein Q8P41_27850 [Pseudomonadota bacterium]|nr:hypothetical protein [Pseudomonadota bacterium]